MKKSAIIEKKKRKRKSKKESSGNLSMEERQQIRRNKRKKRKRRVLFFLVFLLILCGLGYGAYYAMDSGMLNITKVKVTGNKHYTKEEIINTAAIPLGVNLFSVGGSATKEKLMKDPYMKDVKIKRKLPDEITITVTERKAACAIGFSGYYIILDDEEIILENSKDSQGLITLEGFVPIKPARGKHFVVKEQTDFNTVMSIVEKMKTDDIEFKKISFSKGIVRAHILDKLVCKTTPKNLMDNIEELKRILSELQTKGVERGTINIGDNGYFAFSPEIQ